MSDTNDTREEWVNRLEVNAYGVRLLTLRKAIELAAEGCSAGWYISPYAAQWTVGRMSRTGERYHVISDGEPMRFASTAEALDFLSGIVRLAAAPKLTLDLPRLLAQSGFARTA
jgi:hypothetical protein